MGKRMKLQARKPIVTCSVCLGSVQLKDEELAKYLGFGEQWLLLTVITLILPWLRQ